MRRAALTALAAQGWTPDHLAKSCSCLNSRSIAGFAPLSRMWDNMFKKSQVQLLEDRLANATAKHEEDTAEMSQRLDSLQRKVAFLFRRNEKLSEQLGFLNEVAIREAVGKMHGKEAAEQVHIHSLQGLCALLLPKNIPSRQREADLAARQSALVEALTTPEAFNNFLALFLGRLTEYHEGNKRALAYIRKAQAATAEVSLHLGKKATVNRGRVIEAAMTQIRTLEAIVCQDSNRKEETDADGVVAVDELEPEDIKTIPPAYWAGRFFSGLTKYLRAAKGGLIKLRAHLAEPHSMGIALLAAASSQLMCVNFELDGRGSLEVFPDGAVITVFEYKSSPSGFAKGKRQLAARLAMLMWAARESGAVPAGVPVTGRGHLYLPGYARMRHQELALEGGNMTISIASI